MENTLPNVTLLYPCGDTLVDTKSVTRQTVICVKRVLVTTVILLLGSTVLAVLVIRI